MFFVILSGVEESKKQKSGSGTRNVAPKKKITFWHPLISAFSYLRSLISKKLDSKQKEFSKLVKENQGLIIKVSRLYTNSLEDEQDLFQEIVLQLWRSYDSFKGQSKISTWMYRVALNTAITLFRKKTKSPQTDELMDFHHRDYVEDARRKSTTSRNFSLFRTEFRESF